MSEPTAVDQLRTALTHGSFGHRALTVVHSRCSGSEAEPETLALHGELVTEDFTLSRPPETAVCAA